MSPLTVGHWYRLTPSSDPVELVGINEVDQLYEFEHFNGSIELCSWVDCSSIELTEVAAPDDWTMPFDTERRDIHPETLFNDYYPKH